MPKDEHETSKEIKNNNDQIFALTVETTVKSFSQLSLC